MRLLAALAVFLAATGAASATMPQAVAAIGGVTEYRLENGLRVLLIPDSSSAVTTVNVVYLVGSRHERYGETGMAHLLEHLMFKGTPAHTNIPDELASHGARSNGTTTQDYTSYYESFPASAASLEWAVRLEADRMVNSFIAQQALDTEMTVVRNEFERGENNSLQVLQQRVMSTAYLWHNYSHSPIGARSDIEGVPIERLQGFYRTYYQPDNAVLLVGGGFEPQQTLALVQATFGAIAKPARVLPNLYTQEPVQDGQREVTLRRAGGAAAVMLAYHVPSAGHPDTMALDLLAAILSDPASGRLQKKLVDTKLTVGSGAEVQWLHDPGIMDFTAELPENGDARAVRDELIGIAEGAAQEPVTEAELQRVRASTLEKFDRIVLSANDVALLLGGYVGQGDWRLLYWERNQISKMTVAEVQQAAARYLIASNRTVGLFIPDDKPVRAVIPPVPNLATTLAAYGGDQHAPTGPATASGAQGEEFAPTPANIEARTTRTTLGPIKIAYLPKKTRGNLVSATLAFHFGNERALTGRVEAGRLAGNLLMSATARHTMAQLQDRLTEIHTAMSVSGEPTGATVTLRTDGEHLGAALRLAAEILQQPVFEEKDFDAAKRGALSGIEGSRGEPGAVADRALARLMNPGYVAGQLLYVPTLDEAIEAIKAVKLEDVRKFHHDFYGVGSAEMAFVGSFDPREVTTAIEELFASWKSPASYQRVSQRFREIAATTQSLDTPDKESAVFLAAFDLEMRDDDASFPALVLGNYMLGGGFLNSRFATRVRHQEGLSYTIGSRLVADPLDKVGSFSVHAIAAPQNIAKVGKAVREEMARALADGFTAAELSNAKSGYLQSQQLRLAEDGGIAGALVSQLYEGRDFHWRERYEAQVRALTPERVNQAMRLFIDAGRLVTVTAGDFSKTGS
jgi:zinc protease